MKLRHYNPNRDSAGSSQTCAQIITGQYFECKCLTSFNDERIRLEPNEKVLIQMNDARLSSSENTFVNFTWECVNAVGRKRTSTSIWNMVMKTHCISLEQTHPIFNGNSGRGPTNMYARDDQT